MLERGMEAAQLRAATEAASPAEETANALGAANVRGRDYYH
jgi:hypothetical protein